MEFMLIILSQYVQILSRSDDVINVAGHRLSTGMSTYPTYHALILTLTRCHRTIPLHAPLHRRMLRNRPPRVPERPPPLRICCPLPSHPPNPQRRCLVQRVEHPGPLATRIHRDARRHDRFARWWDPEDKVRQDAEEESEGVGGGCE